jgi:hypothetical protein
LIEYTTALLIILLTYAIAVINIKFYLFSILIALVDIFTIVPDIVVNNGSVVVGYSLVGSTLTPLTVSYPWLRILALIGITLCASTAILKMFGRFD